MWKLLLPPFQDAMMSAYLHVDLTNIEDTDNSLSTW